MLLGVSAFSVGRSSERAVRRASLRSCVRIGTESADAEYETKRHRRSFRIWNRPRGAVGGRFLSRRFSIGNVAVIVRTGSLVLCIIYVNPREGGIEVAVHSAERLRESAYWFSRRPVFINKGAE